MTTLERHFGGKLSWNDVDRIEASARRLLHENGRIGDVLRVPIFGEMTTFGAFCVGPTPSLVVSSALLHLVVWRHSDHEPRRLLAVILEFAGERMLVDWTGGVGPPPPVTMWEGLR